MKKYGDKDMKKQNIVISLLIVLGMVIGSAYYLNNRNTHTIYSPLDMIDDECLEKHAKGINAPYIFAFEVEDFVYKKEQNMTFAKVQISDLLKRPQRNSILQGSDKTYVPAYVRDYDTSRHVIRNIGDKYLIFAQKSDRFHVDGSSVFQNYFCNKYIELNDFSDSIVEETYQKIKANQ